MKQRVRERERERETPDLLFRTRLNKEAFVSSTTLPLSLAFTLLLSSPSLVDLVAPSFLMKTLDAEKLSIWEGAGGMDWGGDSDLSSATQTDWLKKGTLFSSWGTLCVPCVVTGIFMLKVKLKHNRRGLRNQISVLHSYLFLAKLKVRLKRATSCSFLFPYLVFLV